MSHKMNIFRYSAIFLINLFAHVSLSSFSSLSPHYLILSPQAFKVQGYPKTHDMKMHGEQEISGELSALKMQNRKWQEKTGLKIAGQENQKSCRSLTRCQTDQLTPILTYLSTNTSNHRLPVPPNTSNHVLPVPPKYFHGLRNCCFGFFSFLFFVLFFR